ncbi:MAG: (Fe-S)-binding protein [Dehalococcoidia bacterium]|nr:(Fe-S)-binding protein [Dehalococcoidia bacterium]
MTPYKLTEAEQKHLDEKIRRLVTPPNKAEYDRKGIPAVSEADRLKYHLTPTEEIELVRNMVEKAVRKSVDQPFAAKAQDLALIGTPEPVAPEQRPGMAVDLLGEMRHKFRSLLLSLDVCTKCGACVETCQTYLGTGDPNNSPAGRVDLMRRVYRRYFTWAGRTFGKFAGGKDIDRETIDLWYRYFYQCNECRRCAVFCPFGIDTCEVTMLGRQILTKMGMVPSFIVSVAKGMHKWGNNMGIPPPALLDTCRFLEEEMKEETGKNIPIPVDQEGAEVLFNPSSSELFVTNDSLEGAAKMFYAAGTSWTLSSKIIETANFGLFFDHGVMKEHNNRLFEEARRLRVKRIVAGECGHGWRTWKMFTSQLTGNMPYRLTHIQDETLDYIKDKRIKLDPSANPLPVTLHDPCNMARAAGYIEQPRQIIKAVCEDFREMWPHGDRNFCCGGSSGLLMDEYMDLRMKFSRPKAEQVKATGALVLVAPCAICKAQLPYTMAYWRTGATVHGLIDMVGYALVL